MVTLSPLCEHQSVPLRLLSCIALSSVFCNSVAQYGIKVACAEPVTGSSPITELGTKNLDTKSTSLAFAVTIIPKVSTLFNAEKLATKLLICSSFSYTKK